MLRWVCADLVHGRKESMDANESWIDENMGRGKNEFKFGFRTSRFFQMKTHLGR
jgi:hypothetical protein